MFCNTYEVDLATMLLQLTVNAFLNALAILLKQLTFKNLAAKKVIEDNQRVICKIFITNNSKQNRHSTSSR